ncbi:MAG: hypothetical protein NT121_18845 [Chloroflexi bacterium]|nr:hypothetical protein [Chloroflexota bacterium]
MNIKVDIGKILTKAWQITWKFKVLWIFGILAGCGGANSNRFNYNGGSNSGGGGSGGSNGQMPEFFRQFQNMQPEQVFRNVWGQYMAIIAGVLLILCVLWVVFYFLGVMGKIGLIKGVGKADGGAESMRFGEIWTESMPYFWRMFILASRVHLMHHTLVSENSVIGEGTLVREYAVLKANVLTVIVMAIILGIIGGIIGLVIAIPILLIAVPTVISVVATQATNFIVPLLIAGGCFVIYLPVLLLLSGILMTYTQSVWTLTYRRMTELLDAPVLPKTEVVPATE